MSEGIGAGQNQQQPDAELTLSEAARTAGVTDRTLRRWLAKGDIPGRQVPSAHGPQWLVPLAAVQQRARPNGQAGSPSGKGSAVVADLPEGYLPVPVEAWQATVTQLANLHQAGQELAEVRERAATAETTAAFLRERNDALRQEVAELRQRLERSTKEHPRPPRRRWRRT
jgi:excisionase family DNA binding protein